MKNKYQELLNLYEFFLKEVKQYYHHKHIIDQTRTLKISKGHIKLYNFENIY